MILRTSLKAPIGLGHYARITSGHPLRTTPAGLRSISTHSSPANTAPMATVKTSTSREMHSSAKKETVAAIPQSPIPTATLQETPEPLSVLPLPMILRSLLVTSISSSRLLLPPSLAVMNVLANATSPLLNPDKNPLLNMAIKNTFYVQFCAGETHKETRASINGLKNIGFKGVILCYAKEVVLKEEQLKTLADCMGAGAAEAIAKEITPWKNGTLETVGLAGPGDFVAVKFTGAGRQALYALSEGMDPPPELTAAINEICNLAVQRGVRLLFDAEQARLQPGIDKWTLDYMRKYNTGSDDAVIFGTYQAYLKRAPAVLQSHLEIAAKEGFTVGVKLVRGAYLGSDPRHLIHDTKQDTDDCYNALAKAVLRQEWDGPMQSKVPFPKTSMVLASHNADSLRIARKLMAQGQAKTPVAFAQLQGMADEVSCELLVPSKDAEVQAAGSKVTPEVFKYMVWGSTGDCMKYLLRRAYENQDAVQRTLEGRNAMWGELVRRMKGVFSMN
ncbi:Proline dehydrogenase 1, mitochondrial [Ceratocystis lukuohia]